MIYISHKYVVQWVVPYKLQNSEFVNKFESIITRINGVYFDSQAYSFILETTNNEDVNKFIGICEDYK